MNEADHPSPKSGAEAAAGGEACGWQEGSTGIIAGIFAAVCCTFPPILAALGFTAAAGALAAMPFAYHLVLQWAALGLLAVGWWWFLRAWLRAQDEVRWSWPNITTGLIMLVATAYVVKTWIGHMFLMPKAPF